MRRLLRPFLILLALVFLLEAWLWSHLAPVVAWIVERIPLRAAQGLDRAAIEHLPPYATLVVFVDSDHRAAAAQVARALVAGARRHGSARSRARHLAKLLGLGVTAFIFDVTRPTSCCSLPGSAGSTSMCSAWLAWAHALVDPIKRRIKLWLRDVLAQARRRARCGCCGASAAACRARRRRACAQAQSARRVMPPYRRAANRCSTQCRMSCGKSGSEQPSAGEADARSRRAPHRADRRAPSCR